VRVNKGRVTDGKPARWSVIALCARAVIGARAKVSPKVPRSKP